MHVFVTGVAGFIGSSVARRLLERGDRVVGIDNLNNYYDVNLKHARLARLAEDFGDRFTFEKGNFADPRALGEIAARHDFDQIVHLGAQAGVRYSMENPSAYIQANLVGHANMLELARHDFDQIVHLGAQAGVRYSMENPSAYIQANLVGHANMLELARHRKSSHMVYASSSSVYGGNKVLPFRVEDRVDHPMSLYAATKKADELISESYAHLYHIPLTGLRFFTVYGPWGRPDMAMWIFTKALYEGRPLPLFNGGKMRRDFTYIDDIVSGIVACLDGPPKADGLEKAGGSRAPHALYNIGNSRSEDLMRVVALLEAETGRTATRDDRGMQPGDVADTFADISAIERDHGYSPTTTIDEGVPRFVKWYRDFHQQA
jgi:UDP-glucuronate 4-epimerase